MRSLMQIPLVRHAGGSWVASSASIVLVLDRFYIMAMSVEGLFICETMSPSGVNVIDLDQVSIPEVQSAPLAFPLLPDQECPHGGSSEGMIAQSFTPVDQVPVKR